VLRWAWAQESLQDAEDTVNKLQSTAKELEASAAKKEKEIAKTNRDNAELQAKRDAAEAEAEAAEREHADVQAGKGSSDGGLAGNTFAEQLASLKVSACPPLKTRSSGPLRAL
jgi:septal ring factor EnvC (AmiA/AmiB activator)